jgi:DNA repair exonuclease SbcCD ATPase subunit
VAQSKKAPAPAAAPVAASIAAPAAASGTPNTALASLNAAGDLIADRKERLEKIKRRVAEAARTPLRGSAPPPTPTAARESAIGLVHDLETQLSRAREIEDALREDLKAARAEMGRTAAEAKHALEKLGTAEQCVAEKQRVLAEMLTEMTALEEERDQSVQRAQALAALDQERQQVLDDVTSQLDETRRASDSAQAEASRLAEELEIKASDAARLRAALAEVTRERDVLAREASEVRRERDELLETRRALEQVHQALATARAKIA